MFVYGLCQILCYLLHLCPCNKPVAIAIFQISLLFSCIFSCFSYIEVLVHVHIVEFGMMLCQFFLKIIGNWDLDYENVFLSFSIFF